MRNLIAEHVWTHKDFYKILCSITSKPLPRVVDTQNTDFNPLCGLGKVPVGAETLVRFFVF